MKPAIITFKTDAHTKQQAQAIAQEMGISVSAVLNALLKDFVRHRLLSIQLPTSMAVAPSENTFPSPTSPSDSSSLTSIETWHTTTVLHGDKTGRTLGFPTANLDMRLLPTQTKQGVWGAHVRLGDAIYQGAVYYGPRLVKNEHHLVLEVYILDFNQEIYGRQLWLKLVTHIRGVMDFSSLDELKKQLRKDVATIRQKIPIVK